MGKKNKNCSFQQEQVNTELRVETAEAEPQQEQVEEPKPVEEEPTAETEPIEVEKEEPTKIELTDDEEINAVSKILNDSKLDPKAKFEAICNSNTKYALLANNLKSYQNKMGKSAAILKGVDGAANNYNLYVILINVANSAIYTEFKLKFDIVNLCFLAYSDDAYSEFKLFRYSIEWKYGKDKYITYRSLAMLIAMLCDKAKRQDALKKIVLSKVLTLDGTKFTEVSIQNVKRYYES
jgi:hypothetical protein